MKKIFKRKSVSGPTDSVLPQTETDLAGLVNKMCEQLVVLEKKVDSLINRSSERHQGGDRFQRPSGPRFRPDEHSRERNFTQAVCSQCGKECEIPFKPTGNRPVYCRDCFSVRNDSGSSRSKFGDRSRGPGFSRGDRAGGKKRGAFFQRRKERS